ncbi:hypothetical protein A3C98_04695 [Candidatus Roizmanbacteria bacterium RIFCSPHIGHO2_02_FULL_37_15]|uniref:Uncharacterized protein n=1 Tax=Candidatus Roizmanbacteria bacterium RIFCSPLOWO2_01_FULL_37_16 TaxID=1802058 RepID=A0A1F7IN43_9BACT|nr:MAG: hypothetical protein A2859_02300 [Candidatus Roizmanbacteria bacterium RIFCSPHIGHO2_01_FULL_37_16b]OGK21551.1 MAG: hypothetical protein A3C98_04695 [Candidatus Roizmanbacteria bacterium RIFCSPHIGHO2_02_FULL_37_15]OGK33857.1 MAG: hypothetical protein A3F57_03010 [Candidatus Roizmanbacteria bacterium RIFCSPHIGHO2_12_FULL_36_11]OGK44816.1 MAG: hypothetical protein A3B40_05215 [Candidatus Roizmanbacteria bacterium RIFCSPLOWO2_01_FULL_37_16]OGK56476.1 MAG: hypothetical protein A3I50_04745 [C
MNVYALDLSDPTQNPLAKFANIASLMNIFLPILIIGAAFLLLVMLLSGGFIMLTAGGSPEKMEKAKKTMTFAILGLIIVILSFIFVKLISSIFNISIPI